jgi:hypothetical protein
MIPKRQALLNAAKSEVYAEVGVANRHLLKSMLAIAFFLFGQVAVLGQDCFS